MPIAMSTIVVPPKTPIVSPCTALVLAQLTPTTLTYVLIGAGTPPVTQDHRCAQLQAGRVYKFSTNAIDNKLAVLSDNGQSLDYQEGVIPTPPVQT